MEKTRIVKVYRKITLVLLLQSAPLPEREVSTCLGSYVVDLLDPNGKKLPEQAVGKTSTFLSHKKKLNASKKINTKEIFTHYPS